MTEGKMSDDLGVPPVWRAVLKIIQFTKGYWLANTAALIALYLIYLVPIHFQKYFFNDLQGVPVPGYYSIVNLIIALSGTAFIYSGIIWVIFASNTPYLAHSYTLLRKNMLVNLFKHPGAAALKNSPGEAISRFRGDARELSTFVLIINNALGTTVFSIVAIILMARISPLVTLIALLPFLAVVAISLAVTNIVVSLQKDARRDSGIVTGFIGEIFGAIQAIKVASAENGVLRHFEKINNARRISVVKNMTFETILDSVFINTVAIGTGIVMIFTARKIQEGSFSVGDFAIFGYYLGIISEWTARVGLMISLYNRGKVNVQRMCELADQPDDPNAIITTGPIYMKKDPPPIEEKSLSGSERLKQLTVKNLTYSFPGTTTGIHDVSFELGPKTLTIVTGRIGSGKTTLLRSLLGLLSPESGKILWNGQRVAAPSEFFIPPRCAYTPQVPKLFSLPVRDNIALGVSSTADRFERAIFRSVLENDVSRLDEGLDTVIGPNGVKLSGGQIQRTAAARMFFTESELMVFDDLSSALDVETEAMLWDRILRDKSLTCLAVSHRKTALKLADQIILLKEGRINTIGSLDELLSRSQEMRDLWQEEIAKESRSV